MLFRSRSDSGEYFKHPLGSLKFSIKQFVIPVKKELVVFKFPEFLTEVEKVGQDVVHVQWCVVKQ